MRVDLYLKHFPPQGSPLRVGTCKAVHGLASGLKDCGVQVTVLCEGPKPSVCHSPAGYDIVCYRNDRPYRSFRLSEDLERHVRMRAEQDALIVANGIFNPSVYGVGRAARRAGVPYVMAPHGAYDLPLFQRNPHLKWPYWYLYERPTLQAASAVQVLDERHREWTEHRGVQTPVVEVPNGYSPGDVRPRTALRWRRSGRVRLLYWGRMHVQQKGLDLLLEAFARLTSTIPMDLTLQGPDWHGEKRWILREIARLELDHHVHVLDPDFVHPPTELMADYDVVCMPSRYEGFGLSALEAMLAGRPVLVTELSGVAPHVVRAGGGVVVQPDVQSIVDGLVTLLENRADWQQMGLGAFHYVVENLSWKAIAQNAMFHYRQLVQ